MDISQSTQAGQAVYSKKVLAIYDWWVLGVSNRWIWRCPTAILREQFEQLASGNHLDVGVGTGYYLDHCFRQPPQRLHLLDLNANSLHAAAARVQRYAPQIQRADILQPLQAPAARFDSISINYLLHCLPGDLNSKAAVFANLLPWLSNDGVVFGSTILGTGTAKNSVARRLMAIYNDKGIFGNRADTLQDLDAVLHRFFKEVSLRIVGCVAVFHARLPKRQHT